MNVPELVAHRGYAARYPENTLTALEAAVRAGAQFVEVDVQLTEDRVPVLLHDASLNRTAGVDGDVRDMTWEQVRRVDVNEPARFGERFVGEKLPDLAQFVQWMLSHPTVTAFVEIKEESLDTFGTAEVVGRVLEVLQPIADRCVIISFDPPALHAAASAGARVGLVLHNYDVAGLQDARALQPDYLFCNHKKTGDADLWPGPWLWGLYEVDNADLALALTYRGALFIETMAIGELAVDPILKRAHR